MRCLISVVYPSALRRIWEHVGPLCRPTSSAACNDSWLQFAATNNAKITHGA
jgi:hypothetical protein